MATNEDTNQLRVLEGLNPDFKNENGTGEHIKNQDGTETSRPLSARDLDLDRRLALDKEICEDIQLWIDAKDTYISIPSEKNNGVRYDSKEDIWTIATPRYSIQLIRTGIPRQESINKSLDVNGRNIIIVPSEQFLNRGHIRVIDNKNRKVVHTPHIDSLKNGALEKQEDIQLKSFEESFGIQWEAFKLDPKDYKVQKVQKKDGTFNYELLPPAQGSEAERKLKIIQERSPQDIVRYIEYFAHVQENKIDYSELDLSKDNSKSIIELGLNFGDVVAVKRNIGDTIRGQIVDVIRKGNDILLGIKTNKPGMETQYVINPKREDFISKVEQ